MFEKTSRDRVKGFLRAKGTKIVNGEGEEIILTGWGLGNWLLPEGYMWLSSNERFDRPRRIEEVVRELTGTEYAEYFWRTFRDRYITREDIRRMAELGYNSVRIPINWRILMEDEPGITWKEEGFALLDRCIDWCEEFGLYAFLDLHGAPGGQTGANIDDSIDDFPRLLTEEESRTKCIELWKELARRYRDRWIVGGYDLLNEPLRPGIWDDKHSFYLTGKLVEIYEQLIAEIRAVDKEHLLSIEGHHWATNKAIFYKRYDDNMVIHFHRYGCMPGIESLEEFLHLSKQLDQPLWLGETGENLPAWYAALYPLSVSQGIGYNLWPWKKVECTNSPYSIAKPEGWDEIIAYTKGEARPTYERAREILDQFLERIAVEQCEHQPVVTASVFRRPGTTVRGTDFDELPGAGTSYSGLRQEGNVFNYRSNTGMSIVAITDKPESKRFAFDSGWDYLALELCENEFASYTFTEATDETTVTLEVLCLEDAQVKVEQDGREVALLSLRAEEGVHACSPSPIDAPVIQIAAAQKTVLKITVIFGHIQLRSISMN